MKRLFSPALILLLTTLCLPPAFAQTATPEIKAGRNTIAIRGQRQKLYFYPGAGVGAHHKVLFAPGDGGHRGFAITIAEKLAGMGYDLYALDTRHYLSSFTGKTHLTAADVMTDFHQLAGIVTGGFDEKITLAGWSTGAGLAALAAADANKAGYDGLIAVSLGKTNILGWRWVDNFTCLTGKLPNEPTFQSDDYLPKIAPLPVFVIQSSSDQFIPNDEAEALFVTTKRPKRFLLIHANNHSFASNRDGFFAALQQGMQWIKRRQDRHAGRTRASHWTTETVEIVAYPF
ncbi:MAG: alpha/beta hydrolase [Blastocatellales bacterium]